MVTLPKKIRNCAAYDGNKCKNRKNNLNSDRVRVFYSPHGHSLTSGG